jgi:hypothetical protein
MKPFTKKCDDCGKLIASRAARCSDCGRARAGGDLIKAFGTAVKEASKRKRRDRSAKDIVRKYDGTGLLTVISFEGNTRAFTYAGIPALDAIDEAVSQSRIGRTVLILPAGTLKATDEVNYDLEFFRKKLKG